VEPLQAGDPLQVGGYRLLGRLGVGGMGQVFLGTSPGGRKVAVKLILPEHAADREFRQRFGREIAAARKVGGFHTAPVVDANPDANPPWMVTAYIPGLSLDATVRENGPLDSAAVRALGAALAEGLAAIHACGLVHRDLKPSNIIMAEDGPRIIDFGIARAADASMLTSAGAVLGTVAFMSPEQVRGVHVGPESDIFSLGSVLAYAATGHGPFDAASMVAIIHRIATQPADLQDASSALRDIISACLDKDPVERPSLTDLLALLSDTPGHPTDREHHSPMAPVPDQAAGPVGGQRPISPVTGPGPAAQQKGSPAEFGPGTVTSGMRGQPAFSGNAETPVASAVPERPARFRKSTMAMIAAVLVAAAATGVAVTLVSLRSGGNQAGTHGVSVGSATVSSTSSSSGTGAVTTACVASTGMEGPLTGPVAVIGQEQLHFAELAVSMDNAANHTQISVVQGDTQLSASIATTVTQQFTANGKIVAVVGPAGSKEAEAVGPLMARAGLAFISGSATEAALTTGAYPTFFRVVSNDSVEGPQDANYIVNVLKPKALMIVDDQEAYSTGLVAQMLPVFHAAGIKVDHESVSQNVTDFSSLVAKVTADTSVVVLPWQVAGNAQQFGRDLAQGHKNAVIFGTDGLFSPGTFEISGSYVSSFGPDITGIPADAAIVAAAHAKYGTFGTFGPPVFAAQHVVDEAIASVCKSGQTPTGANVLAAIRATNEPTSILGQQIQFDSNGDLFNGKFFFFKISSAGNYQLILSS
jgi:ABC-type branched-subunit amino acid transport system substrate-binding protein